jgi:hypothetical protein
MIGRLLNETMIQYCLRNGIELTRSRPYRKNDQAWIEQKNGAIVRKLLGYRRFEGIAAAEVLARLCGASRLFVNFFQPTNHPSTDVLVCRPASAILNGQACDQA